MKLRKQRRWMFVSRELEWGSHKRTHHRQRSIRMRCASTVSADVVAIVLQADATNAKNELTIALGWGSRTLTADCRQPNHCDADELCVALVCARRNVNKHAAWVCFLSPCSQHSVGHCYCFVCTRRRYSAQHIFEFQQFNIYCERSLIGWLEIKLANGIIRSGSNMIEHRRP